MAPAAEVHSERMSEDLKESRNCGWLNVVEMLENVAAPVVPWKAPLTTS